jgi:hypothetical protein
MKGILAIYRREMSSYFVSPIAYIVVGFFLLIAGFFFYNLLSFYIERSFMAQMQAQRMGAPPEMDVPGMVLRNFFRRSEHGRPLHDPDVDHGDLRRGAKARDDGTAHDLTGD